MGDLDRHLGGPGLAPCASFARLVVRVLQALRRVAAGPSLSNRREAAPPTPTGGHFLGALSLPGPDSGAEGLALVRRGGTPGRLVWLLPSVHPHFP